MAASIVALDKKKHAATKVKVDPTFAQIKNQHFIPIAAQEFVRVAASYPIVFLEDSRNETMRPVAMTGLQTEENLFYTEKMFEGLYLPLSLRVYPFGLSRVTEKEEDDMVVCFDENSDLVNEDEGDFIFDENGEATEMLKARTELLRLSVEGSMATEKFIEYLKEKDLLIARTLNYRDEQGKAAEVKGAFIINDKKLDELSDEEFLDMKKRGYLMVIHAHIMSLTQIHRLAQLRLKRLSEQQQQA